MLLVWKREILWKRFVVRIAKKSVGRKYQQKTGRGGWRTQYSSISLSIYSQMVRTQKQKASVKNAKNNTVENNRTEDEKTETAR